MKKILLITVTFPPKVGGMENVLYNIVKHSKYRFDVLTPKPLKQNSFDKKQNFNIVRYSPSLKSIFLFLFVLYFLIKNNREYKAFYLGQINSWLGLALLVNKLVFKKPYFIHVHGKDIIVWSEKETKKLKLFERLKLFIIRKILSNARIIFAVSSWTKDQLLLLLGKNSQKVHIAHNGINFYKFQKIQNLSKTKEKYKIKETDCLILTVSRLEKRKGHDMVIKALSKIIKKIPEAKYIIVGEGHQKKELKQIVAKEGLEQNIIFAGKVSQLELINLYKACDIFVMPNRTEKRKDAEGFGIVFLEANACGKAVIGGKSGGAPSAIKNEETGFLVNPKNPKELADKIIDLLQNDSIRKKIESRAKKWARQHDWKNQIKTIDKIIDRNLS